MPIRHLRVGIGRAALSLLPAMLGLKLSAGVAQRVDCLTNHAPAPMRMSEATIHVSFPRSLNMSRNKPASNKTMPTSLENIFAIMPRILTAGAGLAGAAERRPLL